MAVLYPGTAVCGARHVRGHRRGNAVRHHVAPLLRPGQWSLRRFLEPLKRFLDSYIDMLTDITLLLATLSIMAGALVITGVPTKLGLLLVEAAGINIVAMVGMGVPVRRHPRHRPAAGAGLYPGRHRDRAAVHAGRHQPVGGALLRLLRGGIRRTDAADLDHCGDHIQDRQCVVLRDALAVGADLRLTVHADGRRLHSSRAGRPSPAWSKSARPCSSGSRPSASPSLYKRPIRRSGPWTWRYASCSPRRHWSRCCIRMIWSRRPAACRCWRSSVTGSCAAAIWSRLLALDQAPPRRLPGHARLRLGADRLELQLSTSISRDC